MASPEVRDLITLTQRYYSRLGELLQQVPDDRLEARVGSEGLTICAMLHHVCQSDLWYLNAIDGGSRVLDPPAPDRAAIEECLSRTRDEMLRFLETLAPETLDEERKVPAWWAAHSECPVRIILMHSLAHKYYHSGQLQSTLYAIAARP